MKKMIAQNQCPFCQSKAAIGNDENENIEIDCQCCGKIVTTPKVLDDLSDDDVFKVACIAIESEIHGRTASKYLASVEKVKEFILGFPETPLQQCDCALKNLGKVYNNDTIDFTQKESTKGIPFKFLLYSQSPCIYSSGTKYTPAGDAFDVQGVLKLLDEKGWIASVHDGYNNGKMRITAKGWDAVSDPHS